jgi:hypothetical protein
VSSPSASAPRFQTLSRQDFERDFLARTPVVLTEALTHWAAFRSWTWDSLRERCGQREVEVEVYPDGNRAAMWAFTPMTLGQYLERMNGEEHRKYYLAESPVRTVFPELLGDLGELGLVAPERIIKQVAFVGRDSFSTLHYHPRNEAVAVQVLGTKRLLLYPPSQTERIYPHPWYSPRFNFSTLPLDGASREELYPRYPKFKEATPLEVVLRPGELLYIPVGWWHSAEGEGRNLTITSFWSSEPRHWLAAPTGWRDACNYPIFQTLRWMDRSARRLGLQESAWRLAEKLGLIDDASKMSTYASW